MTGCLRPGQALSRCSCIGPRHGVCGPRHGVWVELFMFARYTRHLRNQQKRYINSIVNKERSRQNERFSCIIER